MYPKILHIYGPFELSSYGLALGVGLAVFVSCVIRHPLRASFISKENLLNLATEAALVGIVGSRLLHVLSDLDNYKSIWDILAIWNGGLSILGGLIGALFYVIFYLKRNKIDALNFLDLVAIYAPLMNSIARIGCFLCGCCYGTATDLFWGVVYTHEDVVAPLNVRMHPTQLYSSLLSLISFFILSKLSRKNLRPGSIVLLYLIFAAIERLVVDFFRGDRIMMQYLSFHQWVSVAIILTASCGLIYLGNLYKRQSTT